jgi:flagellar hook-length control protein FliK
MQTFPALSFLSGDAGALPEFGGLLADAVPSGRKENSFNKDFAEAITRRLAGLPAQITPSLGDSNAQSGFVLMDSNAHHIAAGWKEKDLFTLSGAPAGAVLYADTSGTEIRFTPDEVRKAAASLRESGAAPEAVRALLALADNPMGVTAPDMLQAMAAAIGNAARLTDDDARNIGSFLQRLDSIGEYAGRIMADIGNGETNEAWRGILEAARAAADRPLTLYRDEALALGKGLGLSDQALGNLTKAFAGQTRTRLSPDELQEFLSVAQAELGERAAKVEQLALHFGKAMEPVVAQARVRIAAEDAASARSLRSVEQSGILIRDVVTRHGLVRQDGEDARSGDKTAPAKTAPAGNARAREDAARQGQGDQQPAAPAKSARGSEDAVSSTETSGPKAGNAETSSVRTKPEHRPSVREDGPGTAPGTADEGPRPVQAPTMVAQAEIVQPGRTETPLSGHSQSAPPHYAPQVLKQVEQGLLSSLSDGTKTLELQLSPESLGALTVVLSVKNGEISALLRPERAETAALLGQQMDQLRVALEQQGVRIERLEVQTQMQDGRDMMMWQGMEQHNASRERQAAMERSRIFRIGRLHRNDSQDLVDRNMHVTDRDPQQRTGAAGQSLHIIT